MPHFRNALDRARFMEAEKIAVDLATALMIGEPEPEEAAKDGSDGERLNDTGSSEK